jgi:hypothetical protein
MLARSIQRHAGRGPRSQEVYSPGSDAEYPRAHFLLGRPVNSVHLIG